TFHICAAVLRGHDLSADEAFTVLADWNARCQPPWDAAELRVKIRNAERYATGAYGDKLQRGARLADFYAYMPMHSYLFIPTRESWPASSVDAKVKPILLTWPNGDPRLDAKGKEQLVPATKWLDAHQSVEQMTWMPGEPLVIRDRLFSDGGHVA